MSSRCLLIFLFLCHAVSLINANPLPSVAAGDRTGHDKDISQFQPSKLVTRYKRQNNPCTSQKPGQRLPSCIPGRARRLIDRENPPGPGASPGLDDFCGAILPGHSRSLPFVLPAGTWQLNCFWFRRWPDGIKNTDDLLRFHVLTTMQLLSDSIKRPREFHFRL